MILYYLGKPSDYSYNTPPSILPIQNIVFIPFYIDLTKVSNREFVQLYSEWVQLPLYADQQYDLVYELYDLWTQERYDELGQYCFINANQASPGPIQGSAQVRGLERIVNGE